MRLKTVTSINGRFVSEVKAKVSVFDNALLYAEGLFETFLAIDGRIIFEKEHLDRLVKGSRLVGLKLPISREKLTAWMRKTVKSHPDRIAKLRLTLTSGESARWVGQPGKPQVILSASPHTMPTEPFDLIVSNYRVDQDSVFRQIKTLSYIIHATALNEAKQKGFDDALLLNEKNKVVEVTSANIFWSRNKCIYTPPLSAGCLEGITRKTIIREAAKLGYKINEKEINLEKLASMDEIFISSSLKLVMPVGRIKSGQNLYRFSPGPIVKSLADRFYKIVGL